MQDFTKKIEELVQLNREIEEKEKGNYLRIEKEKNEIATKNEFLDSKLDQEQGVSHLIDSDENLAKM